MCVWLITMCNVSANQWPVWPMANQYSMCGWPLCAAGSGWLVRVTQWPSITIVWYLYSLLTYKCILSPVWLFSNVLQCVLLYSSYSMWKLNIYIINVVMCVCTIFSFGIILVMKCLIAIWNTANVQRLMWLAAAIQMTIQYLVVFLYYSHCGILSWNVSLSVSW